MPVETKDVFALIPEMFPGAQEISLGKIHPNPDNPGFPATEQEIDDLAANIREVGLLNPIKVRPDWDSPFVEGKALHPDNPRLKADGTPWKIGDFNWVNLSGAARGQAFAKLGRETIPGYALNPSPEEAVIITGADNKVRFRGDCWPDYQLVENLIKANPNLTQRQLGDKLNINRNRVTRALQVLPLLNAEARTLIVTPGDNPNKGHRKFSDKVIARLAELGPESTFKTGVRKQNPAGGGETQKLWPYPAIPPETRDLVRRALKVVMEQGLTESKAKKLVAWIKAGNSLESYTMTKVSKSEGAVPEQVEGPEPPGVQAVSLDESRPQEEGAAEMPLKETQQTEVVPVPSEASAEGTTSTDPLVSYWTPLPSQVQVTLSAEEYDVHMRLSAQQVVPGVYGAMANLEYLKKVSGGGEEDNRYRDGLTQFYLDNSKARKMDKTASSPLRAIKESFQKTGQAAQEKTGIDLQKVEEGVADAAERDMKSAANTVAKQYMRKFLKDLL